MKEIDLSKHKVFTIPIKSTRQYLQVFNGVFNLTDKELTVLSMFLDKHTQLKEHNIDVFSTQLKKQIAQELEMSDFNMLNNYIKSLKDKHAIRYKDGKYIFNPLLIMKDNEEGVLFKWQIKMK